MDIEDEEELELIKAEDVGNKERTRKMLKRWCDKKTDASWNNLINALRNPAIGLYPLALQLEGMLLPAESMYVAIVTHIYSYHNTYKYFIGIYLMLKVAVNHKM